MADLVKTLETIHAHAQAKAWAAAEVAFMEPTDQEAKAEARKLRDESEAIHAKLVSARVNAL